MVCWCMTAERVGRLAFIDGTVNAAKYQDILAKYMLPSARDHFRRGQNYTFQQANAPCHTANATKQWFNIRQVQVMELPHQSPDMNLIENLWYILKKKAVAKRKPSNKRELKEIITNKWEKITPDMCRRLVETMSCKV